MSTKALEEEDDETKRVGRAQPQMGCFFHLLSHQIGESLVDSVHLCSQAAERKVTELGHLEVRQHMKGLGEVG